MKFDSAFFIKKKKRFCLI